jgi:hypothetical protein
MRVNRPTNRFHFWRASDLLGAVACEPQVASWDRSDSPGQTRLRAYLDGVSSAVTPLSEHGQLYLDLSIRVKNPAQLLRHYDLENYLTPLALHLGHQRFCYATARKATAAPSEVRVGYAARLDPKLLEQGWRQFTCRTRGGTQTKQWKIALRERLAASTEPALPGPIAVHLAWRCATSRNWVSLWKPTGDAMGPILGEPDTRNPFNPADDRITELHVHVTRDDTLGHNVDVGIWWTSRR